MIEIEDPPAIAACSECSNPLGWMYSAKKSVWISVIRDAVDPDVYRIHRCAVFGQPSSWRHIQKQAPETTRAGLRRARQELRNRGLDKKRGS